MVNCTCDTWFGFFLCEFSSWLTPQTHFVDVDDDDDMDGEDEDDARVATVKLRGRFSCPHLFSWTNFSLTSSQFTGHSLFMAGHRL